MFSAEEQKAIEKHVGRLKAVKEGVLSPRELEEILTRKRAGWITEHLDEMLAKYSGMQIEEQAFNIIYFDHMEIAAGVKMSRIGPYKIKIESYNFCPYLEACSRLGLDTKFVCREIGEPSIKAMAKVINPNLEFSRNYDCIRPYHGFCEEFIELVK